MTLTVLSLFSGIGGLDLGLERAGMKIIAHSEIDPYASQVLAKHWPDVPNLGDITQITDWPNADVVCGGFPCQDISTAGRGAGIKEGTRSGLWFEYARCVRDVRPRYVVVENVAALLARGFDVVLGDLAALGYDAWWDCVPAASVGAPHRRDRVFIVATRADVTPFDTSESPMRWAAREGGAEHLLPTATDAHGAQRKRSGVPRRVHPPHNIAGSSRVAAADARSERRPGSREPEHTSHTAPSSTGQTVEPEHGGVRSFWRAEPDVGRVAHRVAKRVDRLRCLGNAVVPQVAEYIGEQIVAHHKDTS